MDHFTALFRHGASSLALQQALASTLLAYLLCQVIAFVYARTYRGLSYSRSMTQALVVAGIVAAMLMLAIGDSLARGIGIVGTLALIRFRTNLRDPLDMVFVFAAFGAGIAAGTGAFSAGIVGTAVFLVVIVLMRVTSFGAERSYEGVVRFSLAAGELHERGLERAMQASCARFVLVTLREAAQGEAFERAYQVTLKDEGDEERLVSSLVALGAKGVTLSLQEASVEL